MSYIQITWKKTWLGRCKKFVTDKMVKQRIIDYPFKYLKIGSKLIGQLFFNKLFSAFLRTGTTFDFFHMSKNFFSFSAVSNTNIRGKAIWSLQIGINFSEILSQPYAFSASKVFMIVKISFWMTLKEFSILSLFTGIHIGEKKSLKRLAFTQKSEINLLLTSKRGINGIFLLYKNWFNIDQYVLGTALGH